MNAADSQRLGSSVEHLGYSPTDQAKHADVIILNTCVVRQTAEDKAIGRLSSLKPLKTKRPQLVIGLMGCLVGVRDPEQLHRRFPWVDVFLPPSDPTPLLDYLAENRIVDERRALEASALAQRLHLNDSDYILPARERGCSVSAFVPIVLGCSHACSYCIIPYRRGPERSRPSDEIISEADALAKQGVKEITLLGQIVDRYGYDLHSSNGHTNETVSDHEASPLISLLRRIHQVDGLERIRFLTSHPKWMSGELINAVADLSKVCQHFEVPIQAGNDEVLARMRRGYTAADYRDLIHKIRTRIPHASIATDIIVGFPGETDSQFQDTYNLLAELRLDKAHIARYSPRPQTLATRRYEDNVSQKEKERRRKALDDLQGEIVAAINAQLLGKRVEILVEGRKKGRWWGRTRTDKLVFFEDDGDWLGELADMRITWTGPWSLIGEPAGEKAHHDSSATTS